MTYDSLESARHGTPLCQIPVSFSYTDPETYDITPIKFGSRDDANENTGDPTQSATQYPKCYKYLNKDIVLNLIDTPGIADTEGIEKDNKHMKNLLDFISNYPEINAICVLLKPNNARVDVVFKYCLLQLLSHLNKSAADNILFLFTNARQTNYAPGETGLVLKNFLANLRAKPPHVDIPYEKDRIYCFDNEAFRYLVAILPPNDVPFRPLYVRQHSTSWDRSVKECERLLKYIVSLPPHKVQDTVSLNNAKQQIVLLTQPLADLSKTISDNQKLCENHKKTIDEFNGTIEELKKKLYIPKMTVISVPLDKPKMVCGHKGYESLMEVKEVRDEKVYKDLTTAEQMSEAKRKQLQEMEAYVGELSKELATITRCMAKFVCFLKRNALTPFNDAFDIYVQYLIQTEKHDANNRSTIDKLEKLLASYNKQMNDLTEAMEKADTTGEYITVKDIDDSISELYSLKSYGPTIKQMMDVQHEVRANNHSTDK
ncbi:unnamed protein product, partial [Oppiella nova]